MDNIAVLKLPMSQLDKGKQYVQAFRQVARDLGIKYLTILPLEAELSLNGRNTLIRYKNHIEQLLAEVDEEVRHDQG